MSKYDNLEIIHYMLKAILQNTKDFVFAKNTDLVYIEASKAYAINCVGLKSVEEVIGKTDYDLFPDKELAKRYSKNDKELLESGKDVQEFSEEIIDINGNRCSCVVTKYIIRDNDRKAIGIVGCYHNIKEEVEKEISSFKDTNKLIADALTKVYFASNYVDLTTHKYVILQSSDYSRKMLEGSKNIEEAFDSFIKTLVKDEFADKMREFCETDTIGERIKGKSHIDCLYLSKVAQGWCQARFVPVDYDEKGNVIHVLFLVSGIDANVAKELESGINSKKDLQSVFDKVPAGIVQYEWDGQKLNTLKHSKYYSEQYKYTLSNNGSPDFDGVHPDDLENYQKAILEALNVTHKLDYVYRVWNRDEQRFVWTKINAVSEEIEDGKSLVYAIYTDITKLKDVEEQLNRNREISLEAYEKQLKSLLYRNEDALVICNVNISKNSFSDVNANGVIKRCAENSRTFEDLFKLASFGVTVEIQRQQYMQIFNRKNLIEAFKNGNTHIRYEHLYNIEPRHTEWVETVLDIVENPINGDLEGICYAKSTNKINLSQLLLQNALEKDYPMAAIIYMDTDEFYYYSKESKDYCSHKNDCWAFVQKKIDLFVAEEDIPMMKERMTKEYVTQQLKNKKRYIETFYSNYHGERSRFEVSFRYASNQHKLLLASIKNITDRVLFDKYKHDSEHDELTGLHNRKTFFAHSKQLLEEHPDVQFAMLHLDIRHFHLYNTFFGDEAGDQLLKDFAKRFESFDEDYEYWAYGRAEADLFCACFPYNKERFEKHINLLFQDAKNYREDFLVEIVAGAYLIDDKSMSLESMLSRATIAANSLEESAGSGLAYFNEEMEQNLTNYQQVVNDMQSAIDNEEFKVYLQPKYNLRTNKMVGAEALVRWNHHSNGIVSPNKFIPIFERNGFIAKLDHYMWEHVCQLLSKWKKENKPLVPISVNVSRISIYNHTTVQFLKNLVKKYDVDPKYLELELTESAYMDDPFEIKKQLLELKNAGFVILMDDFGSGYSSLNTLREFPIDVLKLDMKFFSHEKEDQRGSLVISSVIRMSKLLNLSVIAEGVEIKDEADYLRSIGCEYVQGYLYNKPMPIDDYEKLFTKEGYEVLDFKMTDSKKIVNIISDYSPRMNAILEELPLPVVTLEINGSNIAFTRANSMFFHAFNLEKIEGSTSVLFKEHLKEKEYQKLIDGLSTSVNDKSKYSFHVTWGKGEEEKDYIINAKYEGEIGINSVVLVTFTLIN